MIYGNGFIDLFDRQPIMKRAPEIVCIPKFISICGLFILAACLMISACATPSGPSGVAKTESGSPRVTGGDSTDNELEKRLRQEYKRWEGTRHRLGGVGSRGIDCSGFVKAVYQNVFDVKLPRTTQEQVRQGRPVPFKQLQAGDLVFFKPPTYPRHVGIYLSGSEFMHASKNGGVMLSKIDRIYWGKYYWTARRIIYSDQAR